MGANTLTVLASPGKALAATTLTVGATTNCPLDTGVVIAIRVVDSSGVLVPGTYTEWNAIVTSATSLTIDAAPVYGSDQIYTAGSTTQVFIPTSAAAQNDLIDGVLVAHEQDGTHKSGMALTLPVLTNGVISFNAPEGFLINGKIVPSVSSNNLTVAIKALDGTNPSATNPVYCRLGNAIRAITGALSVTKNAGTNWCNAGSSELATKEIDYFVYLGYNATDGVVIGFSRYPGANQYSEFSVTTTNEKYAAISTITTAASTDFYGIIGRFAATLSAGAGYTWTVPTFTAINLIQRPIYETRSLSWQPTPAGGGSMTWTSVTATLATYQIKSNKLTIMARLTGTTGVSANPVVTYTAPFSSTTGVGTSCIVWTAGNDTTGEMYIGANATVTVGRINATSAVNFDLGANTGLLYGQITYPI